MELRRAADVMLRTPASSLSSHLHPVTITRLFASAQSSCIGSASRQARRCLSTSSYLAERPESTNSSSDSSISLPPSPDASQKDMPSKRLNGASLDDISRKMGWTSPSLAVRPVGRRLSAAETEARERSLNGGSTASDLISMLKQKKSDRERINIGSMLNPGSSYGDINRQSDTSQYIAPKVQRIPMKMNPTTGRTVNVGASIDVARSFRLLEMSCGRNRVRGQANKQRFHERPGTKRKRLERLRYRIKFAEGFRATVNRVKQLKNQGW